MSQSRISIPTILLWLLILAYVLFFSAYSLQRHATLNTFAADLSYIDQPMWNTLHGRFLERTLDDRQAPRVAEHFEPIIVAIALVFYVWDDVRAILIIQTVALALGALPVYWIAREQLARVTGRESSDWLPLAFVVIYLMFPAVQAANVADFHADPFIVAPLLFAFWYATQRSYRAMWVWAIVAMLVKENLPTLTFMLGLHLLVGRESRNQGLGQSEKTTSRFSDFLLTPRRLHGLGLMVVSVIWFYLATFLVVAPLARQVYGGDGPIYLSSRYARFGGGATELLAQFTDTLALLREPDRLRYVGGLLASVGWLAVLAPEYLLLGLPVLVANMFSNFPGQYSGEQHYSAPLAPAFVIAAIYGFQRLSCLSSDRFGVIPLGRYAATPLIIWLLAFSLGYHYLRGWTPLARDFDWPQRTAHHRLLARFADQIPPTASLSTTPPLHPHLAHRERIYVFPTVADADFVLLDVSGRTDAHPNDIRAAFETLLHSDGYGVVDAADGYVLLSRGQGVKTLPDAFYDFARVQDSQPKYPAVVEFEDQLRLLGYDVVDDPKWRQSYLKLYWQALSPLPEDLRLWPIVFSDTGALIEDTAQRPMVAAIWYPPSRWQTGEIIVTETLPWNWGPRFQLGLAVLRIAPGAQEAGPAAAFADPMHRLSITTVGPNVTLFHGDTWAQMGAFARDGQCLVPVIDHAPLLPVDATFAEGIRLKGHQILNQSFSPSGGDGAVSVVLQWEPTQRITRDYTVFVHLVAADRTTITQSDSRPTWVVPWPTDRWFPDQLVLDGHQLLLPPGLYPGHYQVQVGLYHWESLQRLPVLNEAMQPVSDYVVLGEIQIGP
jgi:uncharacterized membrane protein